MTREEKATCICASGRQGKARAGRGWAGGGGWSGSREQTVTQGVSREVSWAAKPITGAALIEAALQGLIYTSSPLIHWSDGGSASTTKPGLGVHSHPPLSYQGSEMPNVVETSRAQVPIMEVQHHAAAKML